SSAIRRRSSCRYRPTKMTAWLGNTPLVYYSGGSRTMLIFGVVRPDRLQPGVFARVAGWIHAYEEIMIPISILDLAFVRQGATPAEALKTSLDLAQHAEGWGYRRFWLAEHHNMIGIASAATSVVIGYIAGGTRSIRVGAGGVMLPNHAPLLIAEQFGTLE